MMSASEKGIDNREAAAEIGDSKPPRSDAELKRSADGTILSPQPSDDPRDPLNWSQSKKIRILIALSVTSSAAIGSPIVGLFALTPQAEAYGRTVGQIAYGTSIALAGLIVGPFVLLPLSHVVGRTSTIFWSTFLVLICNIWAACMTKPSHYAPYLASRFFAGFGGTVPSTVGGRILIDLFFVHERGRAFSVFSLTYLLGTITVPTIGCFIASQVENWPLMFWWTIPLLGLVLVLTVAVLEETGYDREGKKDYPPQPQSFLANRIATLFPGTRVVPPCTVTETVKTFTDCFMLMVTPVSLAIGFYGFISYGAALMQATLQSVFLLEPVTQGGYGLELIALAEVSFSGWIGIFAAFIYTQLVSDRLPLYLCKRKGGVWKPEYRLQCMWFPSLVILPLGLALFGASVKNHYSPAMLAFSYFLTQMGANAATSIITNYLTECFPQFPAECSIVLSAYRLLLALASGFFIQPWAERVGVAWTFGTAALLAAAAFVSILVLLMRGPAIRRMRWNNSLAPSDDMAKPIL